MRLPILVALLSLLGACADSTPSITTLPPATQAPATMAPERTLKEPLSGLAFQSPDTQSLQADDFGNPALLWLDEGQRLWDQAPAGGGRSCADCHGDAAELGEIAPRYPRYDPESDALINLTQRIARCRERQQELEPVPYESKPLLALATLLGHAARGQPFDVDIEGPAAPFFEAGRAYFYERRGQMNLACHHCHELNAGRMLRGDKLSQGHGTGYPTYRLQWQTVGSLHRRLRFCNTGVRAEPFGYGAPEYVNLELFLAWRAEELPIETPAVRR